MTEGYNRPPEEVQHDRTLPAEGNLPVPREVRKNVRGLLGEVDFENLNIKVYSSFRDKIVEMPGALLSVDTNRRCTVLFPGGVFEGGWYHSPPSRHGSEGRAVPLSESLREASLERYVELKGFIKDKIAEFGEKTKERIRYL